jgi:hypothetical protein
VVPLLQTGADFSDCFRVGTFGKCKSLSRFPPGTGVVLVVVLFTVAGRVTYPVFSCCWCGPVSCELTFADQIIKIVLGDKTNRRL